MGKYSAALLCTLLLFSVSWPRDAIAQVPKFCGGCNFAGMHLAGADFKDGIYVGVNFERADLSGASFQGAKIVAANFEHADMRGIDFDDIECTACNFEGATFDGATFFHARIITANFAGFRSQVDNAQLRALLSQCAFCNFQTARLLGRDLSGISLTSVDFARADLRDSYFDGAVLCWYEISGRRRTPKCDGLRGARVDGTSFRGVQLCESPVDRRGCSPVSAELLRRYSGSTLRGASLP